MVAPDNGRYRPLAVAWIFRIYFINQIHNEQIPLADFGLVIQAGAGDVQSHGTG